MISFESVDERTFERFAVKVAWPASFTVCWTWTASRFQEGYGRFLFRGNCNALAHRASYEIFRGPIPPGLHIDHLCRNRACVNPTHLEAVTCGGNSRRGVGLVAINAAKTQCPAGHPYDDANTYRTPRGRRDCRTCRRAASARSRARRAAREVSP